MASVPDTWLSPEEYLAREDKADTKCEYLDGVVYSMSGASPMHNLIVMNIGGELRNALRGSRCRVYASDLKVTTPTRKRYFYPDLSVICGEPVLAEERQDVVTNPTVIVEVLSSSTSAYDRGAKFLAYQSISSLQEYVLVSQDERRVECYRRQTESGWYYTRVEHPDSSLSLASLGVELKLDEIYLNTGEG